MELKNLGQTAASALIHTDIRLEREHWTMFRNKLFGIAAAAALGSAAMLGSTAAHAVKICDTAPTARIGTGETSLVGSGCFDSVTFAAETLLSGANNVTAASDDSDTATYYNIAGDTLYLAAPADVGAADGDAYIVTITLDGMVFQSTSASLKIGSDVTFTVIAGGGLGDDSVLFRLPSGKVIDSTSAVLSLTASFAVSASGGSATLTMTNQTIQGLNIDGVTGTNTYSGSPIMIAPALDEVSTKMVPIADVAADGFMKFKDGRTTATVGTLKVGFKAKRRIATGDDAGSDVDALTDIMDTMSSGEPSMPNSSVTFSGDFSFASKVFLHGDIDCGAAVGDTHAVTGEGSDPTTAESESDIRVVTNGVIAGTTKPENVTSFAAAEYLCIMVDPEADDPKRIPTTTAYTAMGSYKKLTGAAIGPMPMEQTLGMIERNGTTVRLPYLTTNDKFNQRIRIVNRGSAAKYEMEFHGSGDSAGSDATGTLDANSITVLSLRTDSVVTPSNGNNTSGTLIIEAQPGAIDVATVQINRETGNSDTVVYD